MKNKQIILSLITLFILGSSFSCKKNEDSTKPLPANTEIGANTLIFRVNGGEIINSQAGYFSAKPRIHIYYSHVEPLYGSYFFGITGGKLYLEDNKFVSIIIKEMPSNGKYILSSENNAASFEDVNPVELYYNTDASNTGELIITKLDTANHIISGKFLFSAKRWCLNRECNEVITVDGQFDVKYKPNIGVDYY